MDITILYLLLVMVASSSADGQTRCNSMHRIKICRSDNVNVNYGSAFNLSCLVNQNKRCNWRQNEISVLYSGRVSSFTKYINRGYTLCLLRIVDANDMDKGNWTCTVSGHQRAATSEAILVNALAANEGRPTSHVSRSKHGMQISTSENITVTHGGVINLSCMVNELGICYWKLNKIFVENGGRYSFSREWLLEGNTVCSLTISEAMTLDSGTWDCGITEINGQFGKDTSEVILVNVLTLNTGLNTTTAWPTTVQEENQTQTSSQKTNAHQIATTPPNTSSAMHTTGKEVNQTQIFAQHGIDAHQTDITIYIVFGTLTIAVVILLVMATTAYFILKRKRELQAKCLASPDDHEYEEIDLNAIELRTGPMKHPCTTFQPPANTFKIGKDSSYFSIKEKCNDDYEVPISIHQ